MIDKKTTDYEVNLALTVMHLYRDEPHRWDQKYAEYDAVCRPVVNELKENITEDDFNDVMKAFRNGIQEK